MRIITICRRGQIAWKSACNAKAVTPCDLDSFLCLLRVLAGIAYFRYVDTTAATEKGEDNGFNTKHVC